MTTQPPAPTIVEHTDWTPCPRIEVHVTPMPGDADTITVYRVWGGQRQVVRGASGAVVAGDFFVVDYEAPFGVPVTYSCVTKNTAGTASTTSDASSPLTLAVTQIALQDPLDPTSAVAVAPSTSPGQTTPVSRRATGSTATYSIQATISPVAGSALPLATGDVRQAASGVPIDVRTETEDAATAVRNVLTQAWPLCIRSGPAAQMLPGLVYLALSDITETLRPNGVSRIFTATAAAVLPPGQSIVVSPRTYADLLDEAATYADLLTLYPTYLRLQAGH
ncbi:hypothetical protein [Jatrophihabitans sp.]|uniref:hypothetical protein n=1 Tax=Jatrophihabitans sp. TaxID=1932789 RepID=UPI0030C69BC7|nr:excinuclease subunit [Jatrophihabitans sp.]